MKIRKDFKIKIKIIILGVLIISRMSFFTVSHANNLGLENNKLLPCPKTPNCVLSQEGDEKHKISPILYKVSLEEAKERLNRVIISMVNTRLIKKEEEYWHYEFTTRWLGFVDDVEFFFPKSEALIHIRSASRFGYWDFGINRKRASVIQSKFEALSRVK